ncbi:hypothetical protein Hdeb2414_s0013g00421371 [Helianthus debilis subsp. tardiflorus]
MRWPWWRLHTFRPYVMSYSITLTNQTHVFSFSRNSAFYSVSRYCIPNTTQVIYYLFCMTHYL